MPERGATNRARASSRVDLPEPDAPTSAILSPGSIARERSARSVVVWPMATASSSSEVACATSGPGRSGSGHEAGAAVRSPRRRAAAMSTGSLDSAGDIADVISMAPMANSGRTATADAARAPAATSALATTARVATVPTEASRLHELTTPRRQASDRSAAWICRCASSSAARRLTSCGEVASSREDDTRSSVATRRSARAASRRRDGCRATTTIDQGSTTAVSRSPTASTSAARGESTPAMAVAAKEITAPTTSGGKTPT